jgi:tetratricopeptide (TPR) repeat protein
MDNKKLERILLFVLVGVTAGIYLYTVAPTLSFWDCGEFIASAYTLAVPHPPGTPFYLFLGRVWLMIFGIIAAILPISKEVAWHMNLLGLSFSVVTLGLIYKMMLKVFSMFRKNEDQRSLIIIAFATCLGIAFYYTYWQNAIETEVYAASTFVFVLIHYLAILWYDSVKQGTPQHRYLLFSFYLIFLSTGIHLIPFLIFIPFYIFVLAVERRYLKDILFMLLGVFQLIFFALAFLIPGQYQQYILFLLGFIILVAIILPINNPRKFRNWRFFWAGIILVIIGLSTELYLYLRSKKLTELYKDKAVQTQYLEGKNIAPRINECDPGEGFTAFNNVLHRVQYGPPRLIPRQTQDVTGFGLIQGYYWQMHLFVKYLFWQPAHEGINQFLRAIILALFCMFSVWGLVVLYRREKRLFLLMIMVIFMLSFAMVSYLNLKFSPSDLNPTHQKREVRERDYFFHTGHVYFGMLVGFGFLGFMNFLKDETKNKKIFKIAGLSGIVVYSIVPFLANIQVCNRFGNFIPKDYGYNMLASCDHNSVVFTNGDNDTFPLWFAQEVLGTGRSIIIANLSLINTNWYIKQLKYWGVPISFSDYVIDRLEPFITPDRRVIYVKDIMIRNILATNAGIQLKNEDYFIPQEEFAQRYLKNYKGKNPVYFASTVSYENYEGFKPYLQLEGLVYRVIGDSGDFTLNLNVEKTQEFFYSKYRYTGVFEPKKQKVLATILTDFDKRKKDGEFYDFALQKDDNTRRLYSNYAAGLHNLGVVLQHRNDIQGTINAWRFALLFEPEPAYLFSYNLGLLYAQLGVVDSAEYYFSTIDAKDPNLMMRIGSVYRATGNLNQAIAYFRKAINYNPQMPEAYFGLYASYLEIGDKNSAMQILNDWLKINPRDTSAMNMLRELQNE